MSLDYKGTDFYCDVAIPGTIRLEIVHQDSHVLAFHHTKPQWPVHIVVVPRRHIPDLVSLAGDTSGILEKLMGVVQVIADKVRRQHGAARIITNLGTYQDSKHLHFHIGFGPNL